MSSLTDKRIVSIDRARGFIVFSMVFFQLAERFDSLNFIGCVGNHSTEKGILLFKNLTVADLGAPFFFFIIALNYIPSLMRRIERQGRPAAYMHFVMRYLGILGFGACIRTIEIVFDGADKTIYTVCLCCTVLVGIAGLFTLIFSFVGKLKKVFAFFNKLLVGSLAAFGAFNLVIELYNTYLLFWKGENLGMWGVLQSIGTAGLLMLLFAESGWIRRAVSSAVIFGIFTFIHERPGALEIIDEPVQGGIIGALGWTVILMASTVMADLYYLDRAAKQNGKKGFAVRYLIGTAVLAVIGVFGALYFSVNKGSVAPGYVLFTLPCCAVAFLLFSLTDNWTPKFKPLVWWGTSPIIMYLLQYFFHDVFPSVISGMRDMSLVPALIYVLGSTAVITLIAYLLYSKKKTLKM